MRVRYTPRARADLGNIYDYISERSARGAKSVKARIKKTVSNLGRMPNMGRETSMKNVRTIPVPRYPYVVFYRNKHDEVHIVHIRHGARASFLEK